MTKEYEKKPSNQAANGGNSGTFSAQPRAPQKIEKSLRPMAATPNSDPRNSQASTQPKAPAQTTSEAKPPPSGND